MSESLKENKSALHYWIYLIDKSTIDYISLLSYLNECDFGVLDIALCEKELRPLYVNHLAKYYATHEVIIAKLKKSKSHLDWIVRQGLNMHIKSLGVSFNESKENRINFEDYILNFPELLEIKCWYITNAILDMLSTYSPKLQSFKVFANVHLLTDYNKIENVLRKCTALNCVHISEHPDADMCRLGNDVIQMIPKHCPHLEVLKLIEWANIDGCAVSAIANLTNLCEFNISSFDEFPIGSLVRLVSNNNRLQTLFLDGICWSHNHVMKALGASCPMLKHVTLFSSSWRRFGDEGVLAMVQGCPLLETIDVGSSNFGDFIDLGDLDEEEEEEDDDEIFLGPELSFTDAGLLAIAQYCPRLEILKVSSVDYLDYTDTGLYAVIASCPRLRAIYTNDELFYSTQDHEAYDFDKLYYAEGGF